MGVLMLVGVKCLLALYILYMLVSTAVVWHTGAKAVPEEQSLPQVSTLYAEEEGPDRVSLIETPQDAFTVRVRMIRAAEKSLDIAYYAMQPDETGKAFLGEVIRAADRGVQVRILIDGKIGTPRSMKQYLRALAAHPNISTRLYNPAQFLTPWKAQAVMHDKIILVDGRYLLLGGRNISNRFFGPSQYTGAITHDRDVLVAGDAQNARSVIGPTQEHMDALWNVEASRQQEARDDAAVTLAMLREAADLLEKDDPALYQNTLETYENRMVATNQVTLLANPVHTGKKEPIIAKTLENLARQANKSVMIQTPYATANKKLLSALGEIQQTAPTTLLTNSMASSPNYTAFSNYHSRRQRFVDTGIAIHELQSMDSIHAKSMIVDDRISIVGSLNMDDRSFYIDTESVLVIDSVAFSRTLQEAMDTYLANSLQVGMDNRYLEGDAAALPVKWTKRAGMALMSVFSRLCQYLI